MSNQGKGKECLDFGTLGEVVMQQILITVRFECDLPAGLWFTECPCKGNNTALPTTNPPSPWGPDVDGALPSLYLSTFLLEEGRSAHGDEEPWKLLKGFQWFQEFWDSGLRPANQDGG